jgi:mRNA-degrading endonuclease RelE of RelBE toxin-antitoxin system
MHRIIFLSDAERSFRRLDPPTRKKIAQKIDWLAENADKIIHHFLTSLPDDLRGLCRVRSGDYRILYWFYAESKVIKIYEIKHRSKVYRSIQK